jgi:hypothetical protein
VEGAAADQHVRNAPRLERAHVAARHVFAEALEAPEEQAHVARPDRLLARAPVLVLRAHGPAALADQPGDEGADGVGQRRLDRPVRDAAVVAVRVRHGQRDERRAARHLVARGLERHVVRLAAVGSPLHQRLEGGVDGGLERRRRAEARREMQQRRAVRGPLREQAILHLLVDGDVRAPEAVDRLLRVADREELAGARARTAPVGLGRVVGREQQQDLDLEGIRVLELVHEEMGRALPELASHGGVAHQQVARAQQQVDEVEAAGTPLLRLVSGDGFPQLVVQAGGQIRVGVLLQAVERLLGGVAQREHRLARDAWRELAPALAHPVPARLAAGEIAQLRLETVIVAARRLLAQPDLADPARDLRQVLRQPVVRRRRARREIGELAELLHDRVDGRLAGERQALPTRVEIGVIHQLRERALEIGARTLGAEAARSTAQDAAHALGRIGQRALEPALEGAREQAPLLVLVGHREERVDAGLDRPLVQQVGAEAMDRADARELELLERALEVRALRAAGSRLAEGPLDLRAQPQLHLAGGLLGEGHGDHALERAAPCAQGRDDARHERRGLAGAGGGLDEERRVEIFADPAARLGVRVDGRAHSSSRSASSGASGSRGLRRVRSSSYGPQTTR